MNLIAEDELAEANAVRLETGGKKYRWRVGRGRDDMGYESGVQREIVWRADGTVSIEMSDVVDDGEELSDWVATFGVMGICHRRTGRTTGASDATVKMVLRSWKCLEGIGGINRDAHTRRTLILTRSILQRKPSEGCSSAIAITEQHIT